MLFLCAAVVSTELKLTARPGHSSSLAVVAQVNDYKSFELEKCPLARASKFFATCNAPCKLAHNEPVLLTYPASTATGVSTMESVQAVLAAAWTAYPVKVDLLLRTGCHGAHELQILAQSVELFGRAASAVSWSCWTIATGPSRTAWSSTTHVMTGWYDSRTSLACLAASSTRLAI